MNTWLTALAYRANERLFTSDELQQMQTYFDTLPQRLQVVEALERLEPSLNGDCLIDLRRSYPERLIYTERFVRDLTESLRLLAQGMLADEPRLIEHRLLGHLKTLARCGGISLTEIKDAYRVLHKRVAESLAEGQMTFLASYFTQITESTMETV